MSQTLELVIYLVDDLQTKFDSIPPGYVFGRRT